MTDSAMTDSAPPRVRQAGRSRHGAVAAAAIPAVVLTALGSAAPALAAEPAAPSFFAPKAATGANIAAAQDRIAAHLVASRVPSRVTVAAAAATSVVVKSGDTLSAIAAKHGVGVSSIVKLNGLASANRIFVGQRLTLRAGSTAKAGTTAAASAGTYGGLRGHPFRHRRQARHGPEHPAQGQRTEVDLDHLPRPEAQGLRLRGLVRHDVGGRHLHGRHLHGGLRGHPFRHRRQARDGPETLLKANGLKSTSTIYPGQKLKVSGSAATTASNQLVPSTFLHYSYPATTVASANKNKAILLSRNLPSRAEMKSIISSTARQMGVSPALALAHAYQESGFSMSAVSPANAIGAMQVIPSSGDWASQLVGRRLDLLNPYDNAIAGVAIIRALQRTSATEQIGIASYYRARPRCGSTACSATPSATSPTSLPTRRPSASARGRPLGVDFVATKGTRLPRAYGRLNATAGGTVTVPPAVCLVRRRPRAGALPPACPAPRGCRRRDGFPIRWCRRARW